MIDPALRQAAIDLREILTADSIWQEELIAEIRNRTRGMAADETWWPGYWESLSFANDIQQWIRVPKSQAITVAKDLLLESPQKARVAAIAQVAGELRAMKQQQKPSAFIARTRKGRR